MSGSKVYVGNLPSRVRESDLEYVFNKYGTLRRIDIKGDFGFVHFEDSRDAEDAMRALDGHDMDGRALRVEPAKEFRPRSGFERRPSSDYRLIASNLSSRTSWQDLKDWAREAGSVISSDVWMERGEKVGIIEYGRSEDYERALRRLDDTKLDGHYIKLEPESRHGRHRGRSRSRSRRRRSYSHSSSRSASRGRTMSPAKSKRSASDAKSPSKKRSASPASKRSSSPRLSKSPSKKDTTLSCNHHESFSGIGGGARRADAERELQQKLCVGAPRVFGDVMLGGEGIAVSDAGISLREPTMEEIEDHMSRHPIELLRAPPYCGKTSLSKLLHHRWTQQGRQVCIVTFLSWDDQKQTFDDFWVCKTGHSWEYWLSSDCQVCRCVGTGRSTAFASCSYPSFCCFHQDILDPPCCLVFESCSKRRLTNEMPTQADLLLDEVQRIYSSVDSFWARIKELKQQRAATVRRILFFASYGEKILMHRDENTDNKEDARHMSLGTPVAFDHALGLRQVLLKWSEFDEIVRVKRESTDRVKRESTDKGKKGRSLPISATVEWAIWKATGGHAGLVVRTLSAIEKNFLGTVKSGRMVSDGNILAYLASPSFTAIVSATRAVARVSETDTKKRELIEKVLHSPEGAVAIDLEGSKAAQQLVRAGVLACVGDSVQFASPLIQQVYITRLYRQPAPIDGSTTPDDFVERTVANMRSGILRKSFSVGATNRMERARAWQMEFYRAGSAAIASAYSISPDVGRMLGSRGFLHFYIGSTLKWAIEILREGLKEEEEHESKWDEVGGLYNVMKDDISRFIFVDFRSIHNRPVCLRPDFYYALYSDDYISITIVRKDKDDKTIQLLA